MSYAFTNFCFHFLLSLRLLPAACGNPELGTLMSVKSALDPENKILGSWKNGEDHCSGAFEGVACNRHGKVANISLQGKGLPGKIPAEVAQLKCLSGLYLHYNSLSGDIPEEISNLTELVDLYLNVNSLSGSIPPKIGNMLSLQVLQLCCNRLNGSIPESVGWLKKLTVLALQHNMLTGVLPVTFGTLKRIRRLDVSFNGFSDTIPSGLTDIASLEFINVQNNNLSGMVPPVFRRLKDQFKFENNFDLCGFGFSSLRNCTAWDTVNLDLPESNGSSSDDPRAANIQQPCNHTRCSNRSRLSRIVILAVSVSSAVIIVLTGFLVFFRYRKQKQKIGSTSATHNGGMSSGQASDVMHKSPSSLVRIEYPFLEGKMCGEFCQEILNGCKFNLEEIESATQYFSEANLLGKSNFSCVYKGTLRDGSRVAIRSLSVTSCKPEEADFAKGLSILSSLRHENLACLRGFCCSRARGECFLIYDLVPNGNLSSYLLSQENGSNRKLDWPSRVSIIRGIADGVRYLHSDGISKAPLVHQNISAKKVLLDGNLNPLIMDSGLPKLLANDAVFAVLKVSAAMGYLAPEYVTTGRFTAKSDVYAFGVIILQILTGKRVLSSSTRVAAEACKFSDFVDITLDGEYSDTEAANLAELALLCTNQDPDKRPSMDHVVFKELSLISHRKTTGGGVLHLPH